MTEHSASSDRRLSGADAPSGPSPRPGIPLLSPDFAWDVDTGGWAACVRPYRSGGIRLEVVLSGGRHIVHNYGHGGAGISLSWGCAESVRDMVRKLGRPAALGPVAILGAGVIGLTAATELVDAGYQVSIYAKDVAGLTSHKAGGQWAPSIVEPGNTKAERQRFAKVLRSAYDAHRRHLGSEWGVSEKTNYCIDKAHGLQLAADLGVLAQPRRLTRLPFAHLNHAGWAYETLLVEPPVFMAKLLDGLSGRAPIVPTNLTRPADLTRLTERVLVNCLGYGSKSLFPDNQLQPKKGLLVLLKPQPGLDWLYSGGQSYVFPRSDCVVVGGSVEPVDNITKDDGKLSQIRQMAEDVFAGRPVLAQELIEGWMLTNK